MRKMVRAGAGAGNFDKQEPEPHKNGQAPQHWQGQYKIFVGYITDKFSLLLNVLYRRINRKNLKYVSGTFLKG
jgi:hypothetical protein